MALWRAEPLEKGNAGEGQGPGHPGSVLVKQPGDLALGAGAQRGLGCGVTPGLSTQ